MTGVGHDLAGDAADAGVATAELLRIDYEAALDKLAWSQLQGAWQLPAELARLAIAAGARSVSFEIESARITVSAPGAVLRRETVADFATLLDRGLDAADRHRALVDLERQDAFVLSAIACSPVATVHLATGGEGGMRLEYHDVGELKVVNPSDQALSEPDLDLSVRGLAIEVARARRWLARMARFARIPIAVGGHPIAGGFDAPLVRTRLRLTSSEGDLAVDLAIPSRRPSPHLWLLRHGIIATRATVPGYPAFEAAVEMAAVSSPGVTAADLRSRLNRYLKPILDAAVDLMIRLADSAAEMTPAVRARTARLLLEARAKRLQVSRVSGVRIFALVTAGERRWVSIDEISRRMRIEEGGCAIDAIDPDQDPRSFALGAGGALVLSHGERVLLGELLAVAFSTPPARLRPSWRRRLRDLAARTVARLLPRGGAPLPSSELDEGERAFLRRMAPALLSLAAGGPPELGFCAGTGAVRRGAVGLLLPRDNPTVRACVRAVAGDPSWVYPAGTWLLGGEGAVSAETRRRWWAGLATLTVSS